VEDERRLRAAQVATSDVFGSLAGLVYAGGDLGQVYQAIVDAAPRLVDGCNRASIMLRHRGRFETVAASDEVARTIDGYERELGEGPCVDAIADATAFHDTDLSDGSPWPRLTERVLALTPVRGMAGFRLRVSDDVTGALNLFSNTAGALTETSVHQGMVLASFAAVALMGSEQRETAESLRAGLQSNREIGKALGLMMAFHKITDEQAFLMLRRTSQDLNIKLSEVARRVVEHHNKG
jgi:hypothetical protein